jgi:glycosyltransferase involved in cell wall biosynthesis
MAKKGHDINVFTTSIDSNDCIEEYDNLTVYRYGTNFRLESANIALNLFKKPIMHDLDLVHAHVGVPPASVAAMYYAKKKNKPLVVTYHGDAQESFGSLKRRIAVSFYNKFVLGNIFSSSNVIITPSEYYINESRFLKKFKNKIVSIPNGIDIMKFDIPYTKEECRTALGYSQKDAIILFMGQLTPYKGPDILLKAVPKMLKHHSDLKIIFVGRGEMADSLILTSKKLGIENHVKFEGFVSEESKPLYYRASDIFVLPSPIKMEVFPIVFLEASASGLPLVVSDLHTFKCFVEDGYNGFITEIGNEDKLAESIIYLLDNDILRRYMGCNARKKVAGYSWDIITERLEQLYRRVSI